MAILLIAEHDNASLSEQTAKALTAATQIGGDIDILVAGKGAQAAADAAAKLNGVRKVLLAESDALENQLAEPVAALIVEQAGNYDTIIAPATTSAKNILPRVAALLDVMQISEIMEVVRLTRSSVQSMLGMLFRPYRAATPRKLSPCVQLPSRQQVRVARLRLKLSMLRLIRLSLALWATLFRVEIVQN